MKTTQEFRDINVFDYPLGMAHQWLTVMWTRCAPQIRGNPLRDYESLLLLRQKRRLSIFLVCLAFVALCLSDYIIFPILKATDIKLLIVCGFLQVAAVAITITSIPHPGWERQLEIYKDLQLFIFDLLTVCAILKIPPKYADGVDADIRSKTEHDLKELAWEYLYDLARIQNFFVLGDADCFHEQARLKMVQARRVFQNFGIPVGRIDDYLLDPRAAGSRIQGSPDDLAKRLGLVDWRKESPSQELVPVQH